MTIEIVDLTMKHADVPLLFVCLPEGFSPFTMCFSVPSEKNGPTGCRSMNRQELGDETKQTTRYRGSQDQCSHRHWSLVIYLVNIYIYMCVFIYTVYHKCDHNIRISSTYSRMRFTKYMLYIHRSYFFCMNETHSWRRAWFHRDMRKPTSIQLMNLWNHIWLGSVNCTQQNTQARGT